MKKFLLFTVFVLAIASFGVHISPAHAQTASVLPQDSAALQQRLDVLKATLINLQMKAGMVPAGDDGLTTGSAVQQVPVVSSAVPSASSGLSAQDRAVLQSALGSLSSALASLNATLAANPQAVSEHSAAIAAILGGMRNTIASMGVALGNPSVNPTVNPTPIAVAPTPAQTPRPVAASPAPSTGSVVPAASPAGTTNQPQQTAQASNAWSFVVSHWPTITIILLVALILLILFWPTKESEVDSRRPHKPVKPQTPSRPVTTFSENPEPSGSPATPVATIVAAPGQKVEVQNNTVTVIRPQDKKQPA